MTIELVGWMLIASIGQNTLIAVMLAGTLQLMRRAASSARYAVAVAALGAMVVTPVWTTLHQREPALTSTGTVLGVLAPTAPQRLGGVRTLGVSSSGTPSTSLERVGRAAGSGVEAALPWIVAAWFAGVLLLSLRLIGGAVRLRRLVRIGADGPADRVVATAHRLIHRLGVSRAVSILSSTNVDVPMVVGWVAPVVLIPASLLTGLTPAQLEMLLAHELAHIRRYDTAINLAQRVIESLLFFHPAMWWASNRVREIREDCCDDLAIAVTGADRITYGATLLLLEESRGVVPAFAAGATDGTLARRVRRLVRVETSNAGAGAQWLAAGIAIAALFVVAGTVHARPAVQRATIALAPRITFAPPAIVRAAAPAPAPAARHTTALTGASVPEVSDSSYGAAIMQRQTVLAAATALVTAGASVAAQSTPSFAGNWTLVGCSGCGDSANMIGPPHNPSLAPGWGADVSIEQDTATIAVINHSSTDEIRTTYRLADPGPVWSTTGPDGFVLFVIRRHEVTMTQAMPSWKGDTLFIPITGKGINGSTASMDFTTTMVLGADGNLNVEWVIQRVEVNPGSSSTNGTTDRLSSFPYWDHITMKYRRT